MQIDKNKIVTQDDLDEPAPMDKAEDRVQRELSQIKNKTREQVAHDLEDQESTDPKARGPKGPK